MFKFRSGEKCHLGHPSSIRPSFVRLYSKPKHPICAHSKPRYVEIPQSVLRSSVRSMLSSIMSKRAIEDAEAMVIALRGDLICHEFGSQVIRPQFSFFRLGPLLLRICK
mmetsp:Transcript_13398/g.27253  ORF Transcript_13398/g.27253 Transcript_13398/m.27253 type:complete len:109 (-) Transcript_13398:18-344(-)